MICSRDFKSGAACLEFGEEPCLKHPALEMGKPFSLPSFSALLLLTCLITSCAFQAYEVANPTGEDFTPTSLTIQQPIYFSIPEFLVTPSTNRPGFNQRVALNQAIYDGVKAGLVRTFSFKEVIFISKAPEKGYFCLISVKQSSTSLPKLPWKSVSLLTLTLVPYYDETGGYTVRYDLYIDNDKKKQYQYEITEKTFAWLLAGPLLLTDSWTSRSDYTLGLMGADQRKAFSRTAESFIRDAHKDGFI